MASGGVNALYSELIPADLYELSTREEQVIRIRDLGLEFVLLYDQTID